MTGDGLSEARAGLWSSLATLLAASGTLVCCAIPAMLVALGAGAALSSLVSAFPQVVWLSEHKEALFAAAAAAMAASGWLLWRNRFAPCPLEPRLRDACLRTRRVALRVYLASVMLLAVGAWFAFVLPAVG